MNTYFIKKHGTHELHKADCVWLPIRKGMVKLGSFNTDNEAFTKAKETYKKVHPCNTCCNVGKKKRVTEVKR